MTPQAPHRARPTVHAAGIVGIALLVALTSLLLAPPGRAGAADTAGSDVTWTVRTASNSFGAERSSYSYSVAPGGTVSDGLVVTNRGDSALDLGVYAADGYTTEAGDLDLVVAGADSVGIGAWVTADRSAVTIEPGSSATIPFTLTVPTNATPGDYQGGIVTSLTTPDAAEGINVDRRLGVRIALRVGGDLSPSVAVEGTHVSWDGSLNPFGTGTATLTYTVRNTGNTVLSARQVASVAGPFGWLRKDAGEIAQTPDLLPGESWPVSVQVSGVAALVWLTSRVEATPIVVDASGTTTPLAPVVAGAHTWGLPWTPLVVLALVVTVLVLGPRLRRRRLAARKAGEDARVQAAVDLALARES